MCWAEPDDTCDYYPQGTCECGADLAGTADLGVARSFQQLEIPEPSAQRIQHDLHETVCGCGRHHVAARPPGVADSPVSTGPNLRALAVYLLVFQHVPVERCRELISDAAGAQVSAGFIHSCLRKAADLAADVLKLIATLITAARVAGFDETTLRAGPAEEEVRAGRVHGAVLAAAPGRPHPGILPGLRDPAGLRRRGRLRPVRQLLERGWENIAGHQACLAHILRDYEDAAETYPDAHWPAQAQRGLRGLIHAWNDARDNGLPAIPEDKAEPMIREFRRAVTVGLAAVPRIPGPKNSTAQHPGRDLLQFCRDREDDVLRFTTDTTIWPTNNISERGVRPTKTQQNISGRLTSEDATQDRLDIRSYIDPPANTGTAAQRPAQPVHREPVAAACPRPGLTAHPALPEPRHTKHIKHH